MKPRVVLVTGGTGTIGSSIVRALCAGSPDNRGDASSWHIVANYLHDGERAEALQRATGATIWRADIGDEAQVEAMFAQMPSLYAVIHAAGITRDALLVRQSRADWAEILHANATSTFLVTRAALDKLQDGGRLVLLSSRVGEHGNAGQAAYAASKAAVIALGKCAAREGAVRQLAVNVICPGFVPSPLTESLSEAQLAVARAQSVLNTFGTPGQVAATVQWLLGDEAAGISGQVIHCDSRI